MGPSSAKVALAVATTGLSECKIMMARTPMNTVTLTARPIRDNDHKERFMAETPWLQEEDDRVALARVLGEDKVAIFVDSIRPPSRKFKNGGKGLEPAAPGVKRLAVEGGIGRKSPPISELHVNVD
jgi:hypothetical protein